MLSKERHQTATRPKLASDPDEMLNLINDPVQKDEQDYLIDLLSKRPDEMRPIQTQVGMAKGLVTQAFQVSSSARASAIAA